MRTHRYGISGYPTTPHRVQLPRGVCILEVPVAIWSSGKIRLPVAGGGYLRLIPGFILEKFFESMMTKQPVIIYCHPYEYNAHDMDEYYQMNVSKTFLFTQSLGRKYYGKKMDRLFQGLPFGRFDQVLETWRIK